MPVLTWRDGLCNTSSGYTDGSGDFRRPDRAGRRDAQPDAAAARAARADGVGALRRPAAAAVDGQPPPEGAGRRRLGRVARATAPAATTRWRSTSAIAATRRLWLLVREQVGPTAGGRPGCSAGCRACSAGGRPSRRSSSRRRPGSGIGCATSCSATASISHALPALARRATGSSAISAAAPARSARRSRRSSRSVIAVDASAAMLQAAQRRLRGFDNVDLRRGELEALPIDDARARRGDADAGAAPRARAGSARSREVGARAEAGRPRCSSSTCCRTIARATGSRWATCGSGFGDEHVRRLLERRRLRATSASSPLPPDPRREGPGAVRRDGTTKPIAVQTRASTFVTSSAIVTSTKEREQWQP